MEIEHRLIEREQMQGQTARAMGELAKAKKAISRYNHVVGKYSKKKIQHFFDNKAERPRDHRRMEFFLRMYVRRVKCL